MKLILTVQIFLIIVLLSGCMPIGQSETVDRSSDIFGSYSSGYMLISVDQTHWSREYAISESESFVIGPNERKYKTKIIPHDFDIENGRTNPRYRVYILDNDDDEIKIWGDGNYRLYLSLSNNENAINKELEIKVSTFFYSPFIHGAPN